MDLFFSNLPYEATVSEVTAACSEYGAVADCRIMLDEDGRSKGFGFVTFFEDHEAHAAVAGLNGRTWDGRSLVVQVARTQSVASGLHFS